MLDNEDIVNLTEAGLPAEVIVAKIETTATAFDTGVEQLVALAQAGVHADVLAAMAKATPAVPAASEPPAVALAGDPERVEWRNTLCSDRVALETAEAGSYAPNPWGLHDMHGNVWEWVEDCWNATCEDSPTDGSAWTEGDCSRRIVRGGSWNNRPALLRAAGRNGVGTGDLGLNIGLCVARTLVP